MGEKEIKLGPPVGSGGRSFPLPLFPFPRVGSAAAASWASCCSRDAPPAAPAAVLLLFHSFSSCSRTLPGPPSPSAPEDPPRKRTGTHPFEKFPSPPGLRIGAGPGRKPPGRRTGCQRPSHRGVDRPGRGNRDPTYDLYFVKYKVRFSQKIRKPFPLRDSRIQAGLRTRRRGSGISGLTASRDADGRAAAFIRGRSPSGPPPT